MRDAIRRDRLYSHNGAVMLPPWTPRKRLSNKFFVRRTPCELEARRPPLKWSRNYMYRLYEQDRFQLILQASGRQTPIVRDLPNDPRHCQAIRKISSSSFQHKSERQHFLLANEMQGLETPTAAPPNRKRSIGRAVWNVAWKICPPGDYAYPNRGPTANFSAAQASRYTKNDRSG
jgi:hypothetical protein